MARKGDQCRGALKSGFRVIPGKMARMRFGKLECGLLEDPRSDVFYTVSRDTKFVAQHLRRLARYYDVLTWSQGRFVEVYVCTLAAHIRPVSFASPTARSDRPSLQTHSRTQCRTGRTHLTLTLSTVNPISSAYYTNGFASAFSI